MNGFRRFGIVIPNPAPFQDHRFMGRAVLPGVFALEHLARAVQGAFASVDTSAIADIGFDRFLALPAPGTAVDAVVELTPSPRGGIETALLTRRVAPASGISRMIAHVRARFGAAEPMGPDLPPLPRPPAEVFTVTAARVYDELVPFGPAFRNLVSEVRLWPGGAQAMVLGGAPEFEGAVLGSPLALDAAFHAACAWAQRYAGQVAFPVTAARRLIRLPTRDGGVYDARIGFRGREGARLVFDLTLHDAAGTLCESIQGLAMRDVSGARLQPPDWIRAR